MAFSSPGVRYLLYKVCTSRLVLCKVSENLSVIQDLLLIRAPLDFVWRRKLTKPNSISDLGRESCLTLGCLDELRFLRSNLSYISDSQTVPQTCPSPVSPLQLLFSSWNCDLTQQAYLIFVTAKKNFHSCLWKDSEAICHLYLGRKAVWSNKSLRTSLKSVALKEWTLWANGNSRALLSDGEARMEH